MGHEASFEIIAFTASEPAALLNASGGNGSGILAAINSTADIFDPATGRTFPVTRGDTLLAVFAVEWPIGLSPPTPQQIMDALAQDVDVLPVSAKYLTINPDSSGTIEVVYTIANPDVTPVAFFSLSAIVVGVLVSLSSLFFAVIAVNVRKTAEVTGGAVATGFGIGAFILIAIVGFALTSKLRF